MDDYLRNKTQTICAICRSCEWLVECSADGSAGTCDRCHDYERTMEELTDDE